MKRIFVLILIILILLVAVAVIAPRLINPNDYKEDIVKAIEESSGYKLDIAGDIKISAMPGMHALIKDVTVRTGNNEPFAAVKELQAYLKLKPLIDGNIEINEIRVIQPQITLKQNGRTNNWTPQKKQKPANESSQSSTPRERDVSIKDFTIVDGNISFNNNGNDMVIENLNLSAALEDNNVDIKNLTAGIFGGSVDANGRIRLSEIPDIRLKFNGKDFNLSEIAEGLIRNKRVENGTASLNGELSASGMTPERIFATLNGSGNISASSIAIRGFDAGAFSESIQRIKNPAEIVNILANFRGENKSSKINNINGDFTVKDGVVNLPGTNIEADYAQGIYSGIIDLPRSSMNTEAKLNLVGIDKQTTPKVGLRIHGATSSPNLSADLSDLRNWAIKKYGRGLMEQIPDKYQDFLKNL